MLMMLMMWLFLFYRINTDGSTLPPHRCRCHIVFIILSEGFQARIPNCQRIKYG